MKDKSDNSGAESVVSEVVVLKNDSIKKGHKTKSKAIYF